MSRRREIDFAEPSSWHGQWWDPRYPDERFPGELQYSPEDGVLLRFFNPNGDINAQFERPAEQHFHKPIIHGYANSTPTTLVDARLGNSSNSTSLSDDRTYLEYEYRIEGLVLGGHMDDTTTPVILNPTFEIEQAAHWGGDRPPTDEHGKISRWKGGGNSYSAKFGDHNLELSAWLPSKSSGDTGLGVRDEMFYSRIFTITGAPLSYDTLMEKQRLVLHLLSLATGITPKLTRSQAILVSSEEEALDNSDYLPPPAHLVQAVPLSTNHVSRRRRVYDFVFTLDDVDFQELIPKWVEMNETFGGALRILIGNRYLERPVLESLFLSTVAAAEAIHSKLEPNKPIDPDTFKAAKKQILAGTPEKYRDRIAGTFQNTYSLNQRLEKLMKRLPPELMLFNWPMKDTWMKVARSARGDISHSGTSDIDAQDIYDAYEEVEELLLINILYELGVPLERIREWVVRTHNRKLWPRWHRRDSEEERP